MKKSGIELAKSQTVIMKDSSPSDDKANSDESVFDLMALQPFIRFIKAGITK